MRNRSLQLIAIMFMALLMAACGKKSDSKRANFSRGRTSAQQHQVGTPQTANTYNSEWGAIYDGSYDMRNVVASFLGSNEVTSVSGQPNSSTGIVFKGYVDPMGTNGNVEIFIWDEEATRSGQVISATGFRLVQGQVNQSSAYLVFEDPYGTVTFEGQFNDHQGLFQGTVKYQTQGGGTGTLGSFVTGNCSFVRCHGN